MSALGQKQTLFGGWYLLRVVLVEACQQADPPQPLSLLRARRKRPSGGCSCNFFEEIASSHRLPQGLGPRQLHL
jgi:hypothetical protein